MYTDKWVDFTIKDLTWDEETLFTQEVFEKMCDDKFVSMELDDEGKPIYIYGQRNLLL